MGRNRRHVPAALFAAALAGACAGDGGTGADSTFEARDSAGVVIATNGPGDGRAPAMWTLTELVTIDAEGAGAAAEFGHVADAAIRNDTIFVLDVLAQHVRVFGPSGAFVREIGAPGEGPGELSGFTTSLLLAGDTLSVVDWGRGRIHAFGTDGTFLSSTPIAGGTSRTWWRRGRDGRTYHRAFRRVVDDEGSWSGVDQFVRGFPPTADTVLTFDYTQADVGGPGRPVLAVTVNAPSWDVLADGAIAWTTLEDAELRIHGADGTLERVVRSDDWVRHPPSSDDAAVLRELIGERMVTLGGSRDVVDQLDPAPPELLPAITTVRAGPMGTILVQRMGVAVDIHPMALNTPDPPTGWGGAVWDVLDRGGRRLGMLDLGPRVRVMRVTDHRILGLRRDELGREAVVVWEVGR